MRQLQLASECVLFAAECRAWAYGTELALLWVLPLDEAELAAGTLLPTPPCPPARPLCRLIPRPRLRCIALTYLFLL